ncbi:MAG: 2OG-Fe dioxygenase family protein [Acetobacteraceae bacterium]|nr:2OG-Fe dioxygenase family protein [Acetobacteraceae bacterium]
MIPGEWAKGLEQTGFVFAQAPQMRAALGEALRDWDAFARSWDDLGQDTYMADGGRYRKRRHAAFRADPGGVTRKAHQPHYQSRDYNALNGGIARWFEPLADSTAATSSFQGILGFCNELFSALTPAPAWHVEVHQFRIEARPEEAGKPTPEGVHQDGVDWVLVLMVHRENIAEGETSIHGLDRLLLGSFTLREPLDAALLDDHRVFHGVTPVRRVDPARPAHRDVLVVTFRRES